MISQTTHIEFWLAYFLLSAVKWSFDLCNYLSTQYTETYNALSDHTNFVDPD